MRQICIRLRARDARARRYLDGAAGGAGAGLVDVDGVAAGAGDAVPPLGAVVALGALVPLGAVVAFGAVDPGAVGLAGGVVCTGGLTGPGVVAPGAGTECCTEAASSRIDFGCSPPPLDPR